MYIIVSRRRRVRVICRHVDCFYLTFIYMMMTHIILSLCQFSSFCYFLIFFRVLSCWRDILHYFWIFCHGDLRNNFNMWCIFHMKREQNEHLWLTVRYQWMHLFREPYLPLQKSLFQIGTGCLPRELKHYCYGSQDS